MMDSFLHPERGYEQGQDALQKGWQEASGYMRPYQQAGVNQIGNLEGATNALLDPAALEAKWASGYQESPYAKDEISRSQGMGLDAASAMGLGGSSAALENIQRSGSSIMNADRRNYLQDLMQKYLAGVQSSQNIFGTGAGVGTSMGEGAMRTGEGMAQMRYGAANAPGELFGNLFGTGVSAAGTAMTGIPMVNNPMSKGGGAYQPWQSGGGY